jgi:putative ATP-binding cassette transporter
MTSAPLAYEALTLLSSADGKPLLKDLSISIPFGTRTLLTGPNQAAGDALFRATAGLATAGSGRIIRPRANDILFLPQRPYLPPGALRQFLVSSGHEGEVSDDRIFRLLRELNLERVATDAGGLESDHEWEARLSLRDQQLLVFLRILLAMPRFVFVDRIGTELGSDQMRAILSMLSESSIAYVYNGEEDDARDLYDAVLVCEEDGGWKWLANRS